MSIIKTLFDIAEPITYQQFVVFYRKRPLNYDWMEFTEYVSLLDDLLLALDLAEKIEFEEDGYPKIRVCFFLQEDRERLLNTTIST